MVGGAPQHNTGIVLMGPSTRKLENHEIRADRENSHPGLIQISGFFFNENSHRTGQLMSKRS